MLAAHSLQNLAPHRKPWSCSVLECRCCVWDFFYLMKMLEDRALSYWAAGKASNSQNQPPQRMLHQIHPIHFLPLDQSPQARNLKPLLQRSSILFGCGAKILFFNGNRDSGTLSPIVGSRLVTSSHQRVMAVDSCMA